MSIPAFSGLEPLRVIAEASRQGSSFINIGERTNITGSAGFPLGVLTCILVLMTFGLASCSRAVSFEKDGWQIKVDGDYPNREAMVQDLMNQHTLVGQTTQSITELLGEEDHVELVEKPEIGNENYMAYQVLVDFGCDIDPVHTKYLVLEFNEDSVVTKVDLLEWKQR